MSRTVDSRGTEDLGVPRDIARGHPDKNAGLRARKDPTIIEDAGPLRDPPCHVAEAVDVAEDLRRPWAPKDGGLRAWMVVAASFVISGLRFGVLCSFSVIYVELLRIYQEQGMEDASSKASLVGSLTIGVWFLMSPLAGILTDLLGLRATAVTGAVISIAGMLASSWLVHWVEALYVSHAIVFGLGLSLSCVPSFAILGFHFQQRIGLANGVVTAGGSLFSVFLPPAIEALLPLIGLPGVLRVFALLHSLTIGCAFFFKVPEEAIKYKQSSPKSAKSKLSSLVNTDIWKNKKYVVWCLGFPIAFLGYFVPYVHIVKFVNVSFPERDGKMFVMCIGFATGISRIIFGLISDLKQVNRIYLQQIAFFATGSLIMLLSVAPKWGWVVVIVVCIGLFDGGFMSMIGGVANQLCGVEGGAQAIGFIYGVCSIPLTVGPPVAGLIFDRTQSYYIPFLMAGSSPILSGLILFAMHCVRDDLNVKVMQQAADCSVTSSAASLAQLQQQP